MSRLSAKDLVILDIANKFIDRKGPKLAPISVSVNFKEDYYDIFPELYNLVDNKTFKTGILQTLTLLVDAEDSNNIQFSLRLDKFEYGDDREGNHISTHRLLTKKEIDTATNLDDVHVEFSEKLEKYLTGTLGRLDSFMDLIVPVIENLTVSIIYGNVKLLTEDPNWLSRLNINPLRKTLNPNPPTEEPVNKIPVHVQRELQYCFTNYFNTIYGIYSVLSAGFRGDDLTTPDIMASCVDTPAPMDTVYVRGQFNPPTSVPRLPLFSNYFIKQVLSGFIPLFTMYSTKVDKDTVGCDVFYEIKRAILDSITKESEFLRTYNKKYKLPTEIMHTSEIIKTLTIVNNLFPDLSRPSNANSEVSKGNYHMQMLDCITYDSIFKANCPTLNTKQYRLADLVNMLSPLQLNNDALR